MDMFPSSFEYPFLLEAVANEKGLGKLIHNLTIIYCSVFVLDMLIRFIKDLMTKVDHWWYIIIIFNVALLFIFIFLP
jgi:hypothetical protein